MGRMDASQHNNDFSYSPTENISHVPFLGYKNIFEQVLIGSTPIGMDRELFK